MKIIVLDSSLMYLKSTCAQPCLKISRLDQTLFKVQTAGNVAYLAVNSTIGWQVATEIAPLSWTSIRPTCFHRSHAQGNNFLEVHVPDVEVSWQNSVHERGAVRCLKYNINSLRARTEYWDANKYAFFIDGVPRKTVKRSILPSFPRVVNI